MSVECREHRGPNNVPECNNKSDAVRLITINDQVSYARIENTLINCASIFTLIILNKLRRSQLYIARQVHCTYCSLLLAISTQKLFILDGDLEIKPSRIAKSTMRAYRQRKNAVDLTSKNLILSAERVFQEHSQGG